MTTNDALAQLQGFFRELFQFDLADLDFGLYRLFRLRREEIEKFINESLPQEVDTAFAEYSTEERQRAHEEYEPLKARMEEEFGSEALLPDGSVAPEIRQGAMGRSSRQLIADYENAHRKIAAVQVTEGHKAEVFNHLYAFFSRYYEDGDFIPKQRYGRAPYALWFEDGADSSHDVKYKNGEYCVPAEHAHFVRMQGVSYHGEEVFFSWATRDMHYVKTVEHFRDYTFKVVDLTGEYRVRFTMTAANIAKDNTKGKTRYFFPRPDLAKWDAKSRTFILPFEYRLPTPQEVEQYGTNSKGQAAILETSLPKILSAVPDKNLRALLQVDQRTGRQVETGEPELPLLLKRMRHFCRKNTSDFFIHKDLRGFLTRELEFYIKDQILHALDVEADWDARRRVIRVFRRLADKVIDFLANIEDTEKRLFEKKKFVLETDYLIPFQHVPETFWREIAQNQAQLDEWHAWGMLETEVNLFDQSGEVNAEFLRAHPTLPVHTRHFDRDFVWHLLEALPFKDLDETADGLLVHGENYQALRLLENQYELSVQSAYLDPPYNTSEETFVYKNFYRHSSWLAMMYSRLSVLRDILADGALLFIAIDDTELYNLKMLVDDLLGSDNYVGTIVVQSNPRGRGIHSYYATSHDYYLVYTTNPYKATIVDRPLTSEQASEYKYHDSLSSYRLLPFRRSGGLSTPDERPNSEFALYYSETLGKIIGVGGKHAKDYPAPYEPSSILCVPSDEFEVLELSPDKFWELAPKDTVVIMPVDSNGYRRVWRWSDRQKVLKAAFNGEFVVQKNDRGYSVFLKDRIKLGRKPRTVWISSKYDASSHGTNLLQSILGKRRLFGYPKSLYSTYDALYSAIGNDKFAKIVDIFAGSGTTGHAIINMNREDGGRRKFILVEMGKYFDTVLLPRIAKVMYSPEWKNGKPKRQATPEEAERTPRVVKIIRLESYEDTLHNLAVAAERTQGNARERAIRKMVGEEAYLLRYWLELPLAEAESTLGGLELAHPFAYRLEILTDEGPVYKPVDVVETFNYLYGLRVQRYETWRNPKDGNREYRVVKATDREGKRRILVLWRDMGDNYAPEKERAFLESKVAAMENTGAVWDEILINGDTPTPRVYSLDPLFKRLMMGEAI